MSFPARPDWWRYSAEPVWLPTADEMAAIDASAISSGAIPERALIENAGRSLARAVAARWPEGRVAVLAGSGHNGADALVAGRSLRAWGREVRFLACGSRAPEPDVLAGWGLELEPSDGLAAALAAADVAIDGILGTGLETAPREPQAGMIEALNGADVGVAAVDGPSGIDFTTGAVPGAAVRADLTVTFGWPKTGLLALPARRLCGDILAVEIGFPPPDPRPRARAITAVWGARLLAGLEGPEHKGQAGYVAVVGGRAGMAGAVVLAARAAQHAGAGIVRVVSDAANREIVQTAVPAAIFVDWTDIPSVRETVRWAHAVAVGPGLGDGEAGLAAARAALEDRAGPAVLDADGLGPWAGRPRDLSPLAGRGLLLTPHPGEMARLRSCTIDDVRADPRGAARELSGETGATVLLKGTPSWVTEPGGGLRATTIAGPALATGGMGDVLTGACGAYLARGLAADDAATAALVVTGLAATSPETGPGHPADEIAAALPAARAALGDVRPGRWPGVVLALPDLRAAESA